jgi:hypothetical protein
MKITRNDVVLQETLPPTDGPIRFEGEQMTQAELADLASLAPEEDPFNQPLVQQISSEEWEDLTRDPSPLVVEIFATWYVICDISIFRSSFISFSLPVVINHT